jgi:hypothetical protein
VFFIMLQLYTAGVPLRTIFGAYLGGPVALSVASAAVLWRPEPFLPPPAGPGAGAGRGWGPTAALMTRGRAGPRRRVGRGLARVGSGPAAGGRLELRPRGGQRGCLATTGGKGTGKLHTTHTQCTHTT